MRAFVPPVIAPWLARSLAPSLPYSWVCSAAHAPSHPLVRTSPCSPTRLSLALLAHGADTPVSRLRSQPRPTTSHIRSHRCTPQPRRSLSPELTRLRSRPHLRNPPTDASALATQRDTPLALFATNETSPATSCLSVVLTISTTLLTVSPSIRAHSSTPVPARPAPLACTPSRLPRRALARLCCSPPTRLCAPISCVLLLVLGHTGVPAPSGPPMLILCHARVLPVSLVPACASDARSTARSGPSPHAVSRSPRRSQLDYRCLPSSLARTASPWRVGPRSSLRRLAALRSLHALVLPSSRSGPFTRSCLAAHVLGSARPRTRLLARTSACSPARLPPAPGANTSCLLARALDLGPPRLIPAPAVTHRSPSITLARTHSPMFTTHLRSRRSRN
ncbi:hypothetical protein FRC08_009309 [Ceratobasidium sp. 394]|nr:hypothetical protein FRC08_009309 [Ceratobasidium sp. 394]